jgi:UDP-N-acetylglucosamine 4,6-dehydratase
MIPADEAAQTVELDDCYVILPAFHDWETRSHLARSAGTSVPPGFVYSSDGNTDWLDAEGLLALVQQAGITVSEPVPV